MIQRNIPILPQLPAIIIIKKPMLTKDVIINIMSKQIKVFKNSLLPKLLLFDLFILDSQMVKKNKIPIFVFAL